MGQEVISKISFICSDMWEPYLKRIREKCSEAMHILDRFHIVANMSLASQAIAGREPPYAYVFRVCAAHWAPTRKTLISNM